MIKNKKQESISDLIILTNTKYDSVNNNTNYAVKEGNVQNTIWNYRIDHATTATVVNNRFTMKFTLDIRPKK